LDEYIETTEKGIHMFSGCKSQRQFSYLTPPGQCGYANHSIAHVKEPNMESLENAVKDMVKGFKATCQVMN